MAATAGYEWSQPPGIPQSPDTTSPSSVDLAAEYSPVYPGRPIRPLPRRRIRARLSLEQAEAIEFPPIPAVPSSLFDSRLGPGERGLPRTYYSGDIDVISHDEHDHDHDHDHEHGHTHEHTCGCDGEHSELDSEEEEEEEEEEPAALAHRYSWPGRMMRLPRQYLERVTNRTKPPAPDSATSSADGYESFENTNNKKKRKIPVSSAALPGSHDTVVVGGSSIKSLDMANLNGRRECLDQYHQPGHAGPGGIAIGISGAGRGRNGRHPGKPHNERRPLGASANASNAHGLGMSGGQGIISSAIASAAENGFLPTPKGQENVSLLDRQKEGLPPPQTFTFESEPKLRMSPHPPITSAPGTQRAPVNPSTSQHIPPPDAQDVPRTEHERTESEVRVDQNRELKKAARMRRAAQQAKNRATRPQPEDRWSCYFCEYEDIFGEPPRALIRQYELKDAKARKDAAEKKRLLDKAKAKGRKLKKGARPPRGVNPSGGHHGSQSQYYDDQYDALHPPEQDRDGDEFFDDGVGNGLPPTPYPDLGGPSHQYGFPPQPTVSGTGPPNKPAG